MIASLAEDVIQLGKSGNELARDIIQQATRMIAEYIIEVRDLMKYGDNDIMLAGNGSVLRNDYFLTFHLLFPNLMVFLRLKTVI